MSTPRIWIGSLEDYNAGRLHGRWIDLEGMNLEDVRAELADILESSPAARATGRPSEEFEIFDYEGLPREIVGAGLEAVIDWLEVLEDVTDGDDTRRAAFVAYCHHIGIGYAIRSNLEAIAEEFADAYIGTYSDAGDFAGEFLETYHPELIKAALDAGVRVDLRDAVAGWETDWLKLEDVPGGVAAWRRV